ncbi:MAG TPA: transglycosylase domain-containing protein [Patescibacteria group bacterium]|nr:transglycosylase domain-containing protein [Patescibacteria group bacterium]
MTDPKQLKPRKRPGKNVFTTKTGSTIKLNRSIGERIKANKDAKARRRATYLSTLPKNRFKRILYRLHPKRVFHYWFSRQGGIMALKIAGIGIIVFFVLIVGIFAYFRKDLPNIKDISGTNLGGSITYYDKTGKTVLFQDYDAVKRIPVDGNAINQNVKNATIAIEDKDFYKHGAFDVRGILRAGVNDVFGGGGVTQGGSTITQQLVKLNQDWTADRTITRKFKEVILAVELEREYSKQDILTGYLNIAPYGPVEYGVQVAAQDYFGIDAKDLSLAQSAMLAAIPKSPNVYSPYGPLFNSSELLGRQHYILDQMANQKLITKQQATDAKKVDILAQVKPRDQKFNGIKAPYFVLAAKKQLEEKYGTATVKRGGWKVVTTVDLALQAIAEKSVADDIPAVKAQGGDEAAFVAEDNKTGQIVALVGGVDFNDADHGQINYATDVNISPGSTFKPYDYSTFIENNNAGAGSVFYDAQTPKNILPGYPCTNTSLPPPKGTGNCLMDYDFKFPGAITIRYALGGSRNIPAVKAMLSAVPNDKSTGRVNSINKTISTAESLMAKDDSYNCYQSNTDLSPGADPTTLKQAETQCYGASAIGDGAYLKLDDHVNGLASLARLGVAIPKTYIIKITDASNKVLDEFKQPTGKQAVRADTAYILDDMASDPNASYLPGRCTTGDKATCTQLSSGGYKFQRYNGWHFAVKTGTTNDGYDGLMASWSTQFTAVTWVGYHTRNKAMHGAGMEYMTEPIVRAWMQQAHDTLNMKPVNWQAPASIKTAAAYVIRNHVGIGSIEPSTSTDIFPSWYNVPKASSTSQTIDMVSNKTATSCTPDLAKKTEGGANDNIFSVDVFASGGVAGTSVTGTDDVHNCNDTKPSISISGPNQCSSTADCQFTVTVTKGTHDLSGGSYTTAPAGTVNFVVDGKTVETQAIGGDVWTHTFLYTPTGTSTMAIHADVIDSVLYSASSDNLSVGVAQPTTPVTTTPNANDTNN